MKQIDGLISKIVSDKTIEEQKKIAAKAIKAFAKNASIFRNLKVSDYYLYIDTESRTCAIILRGLKPNAGRMRGYNAPVDKRKPLEVPKKVKLSFGWRTVRTERKTAESQGVKALEADYFGVSGQPDQYFGLKRKNRIDAFGLVDETAVPVYSNTGFVEWLTIDNAAELERICIESGYAAINKEI